MTPAYSTTEAAEFLAITRQAVLKAFKQGRLKARTRFVGGRKFYFVSERNLLAYKSKMNGGGSV